MTNNDLDNKRLMIYAKKSKSRLSKTKKAKDKALLRYIQKIHDEYDAERSG